MEVVHPIESSVHLIESVIPIRGVSEKITLVLFIKVYCITV